MIYLKSLLKLYCFNYINIFLIYVKSNYIFIFLLKNKKIIIYFEF